MKLFALALVLFFPQDNPQDIARKDLPKAAECIVCTAKGEGHEEERPAAGVMYKGKPYYFCNAKEAPEFKKNPDHYLPLDLPMPLPKMELRDETGQTWSAEKFRGRLVLLDYWATWCAPCLALKPKLDKMGETYASKGFEVLSISIDERRETFLKFLAKKPFGSPVAWDNQQTWAKLRVVGIPALFLVKDGVIVDQFRGKVDPMKVESAIRKHLGGIDLKSALYSASLRLS